VRSFCLTIFLFAFFAPIKTYATEQIPDYLIRNGKKYPLEDNGEDISILSPYLAKANKWEWTGQGWCSGLYRRYYATFEIVNNELILKDIRNCSKSLLNEFLSAFNVKDSIFKLDWFTGSIIIGEDKALYANIHEYYSILYFEKGMFIREMSISYKELDLDSITLEIFEHYLETEKEDKSEFLTKLKTEYKKKFGEPISDFELTIQNIRVYDNKYYIEVTRTLYGARARYFKENPKEQINVLLNIEEWLDFIRALFTCCLDKWEKTPPIADYYILKKGKLYVNFSSKGNAYTDRYEFSIKDAKQPNLKKFEKIMEDMVTKVKKQKLTKM
jgi:hypothetical protein